MFLRKISSISVIFVLLFTLVANTVCSARNLDLQGRIDVGVDPIGLVAAAPQPLPLKKFFLASALFTVTYFLVKIVKIDAEYKYQLGKIDAESGGYYTFPYQIKSVDTKNNKNIKLKFSVENELGELTPGYVGIGGTGDIINDAVTEGFCEIEYPVSDDNTFWKLFDARFTFRNRNDYMLPFSGTLSSNVKLKLNKTN